VGGVNHWDRCDDTAKESARKGAPGANGMVKRRLGAILSAVAAAFSRRASDGEELCPSPSAKLKNRAMFWIGLVCAVLSVFCGLATYLILTGLTPIKPPRTNDILTFILELNLPPITVLIGVIALRAGDLWRARRHQAAGSELHVRIVSVFGVITVLPAISLAVFASVAFDRAFDFWNLRTITIVDNARDVATVYLDDHLTITVNETKGLAREIESLSVPLTKDRTIFGQKFSTEAALRNVPQAYLIDHTGKVLLSAQSDRPDAYRLPPRQAFVIANARRDSVVPIEPQDSGGRDGVPLTFSGAAGLKKLRNFDDVYLYVERPVNPAVVRHLIKTITTSAEYEAIKEIRNQLQLATGVMYLALALTLLLGAIWLGMWFASRLVTPIQQIIAAALEVSHGNLDVCVEVDPKPGDLAQLGSSFNKMTSELRSQRSELVETNAALDERRGFIEAVLSGVTAGVIGVDANGVITLANRSAVEMLCAQESALIGARLEDAASEFADLLNNTARQGRKPGQAQITMVRNGSERSFAVRVTREGEGKQNYGLVVTFDDISELVVAQRTSAWADVARRLAHEIKNPLTPIQLSAERIRRKYGSSITKDREIFDRCTDTIIRHVGDIGRMVDEFSSFARMPKPDFEEHNLAEVVREAVILFQMSHPEIKYVIDAPKEPSIALCDRRLITQAITNLVKNAGEAIAGAAQLGERGPGYKGRITARLRALDGRFTIEVTDNGVGLPKENRYRLVEPYVTTRQKGTGLGLAIVQRITEQHGGLLELEDAPPSGVSESGKNNNGVEAGAECGALVRLTLPAHRVREGATRGSRTNAGAAPRAALGAS
jgi:two-component system, NtrC family, nitrogen regulation sensor histidine kinase NtrY